MSLLLCEVPLTQPNNILVYPLAYLDYLRSFTLFNITFLEEPFRNGLQGVFGPLSEPIEGAAIYQ